MNNITITSVHNDIVKQVIALKQKKFRDEQGLFVVEGKKQVAEISKDWKIKFIITTNSTLSALNPQSLTYIVSDQVFKKISGTETPQGILAVVEKKKYDINNILAQKGLFVICDNLQDPGNIGTIIRTAEAFSCKGIFLSKNSADIYNEKVVRSTMGTIFNIPIFQECDIASLIGTFKEKNIKTYALALDGSKNLQNLKIGTNSIAIVVGNESNGISREILKLVDEKIRIEMTGKAESLNA
ncbi:MAG: RNA methyltransferase, partial [Elusimicrobia bacterium]|nr:RNA methyltransferase [Elusimicrobiota bacterium]